MLHLVLLESPIGLDERTVGIEDEHQGTPYWGARGRAPETVSALKLSNTLRCLIGMLIGLDERMDGIEDEHQGGAILGCKRAHP